MPQGEDVDFDKVQLAIRFISDCNQSMGYRAWAGADSTEVKEQELHYKQEAAFSKACEFVGDFFTLRRAENAKREVFVQGGSGTTKESANQP
jgi:hypothetical protein